MSRIAFLYPGQGAQEVGMAGDFYEKSEEAKAVFDQASSILDFDVREICFQKNDLLDKTEYTQAAMVTACLAITRELEKRGLYPEMTAGLSLGEYCAIAAAGSMSDMDAVRTVRARGIFMEHAAPEGTGAMAAVLGMDGEAVERTVHDFQGVFIANYNCPGHSLCDKCDSGSGEERGSHKRTFGETGKLFGSLGAEHESNDRAGN